MEKSSLIGISCVVLSFLMAFSLSRCTDEDQQGMTTGTRHISMRGYGSSSGSRGWGFGGK